MVLVRWKERAINLPSIRNQFAINLQSIRPEDGARASEGAMRVRLPSQRGWCLLQQQGGEQRRARLEHLKQTLGRHSPVVHAPRTPRSRRDEELAAGIAADLVCGRVRCVAVAVGGNGCGLRRSGE